MMRILFAIFFLAWMSAPVLADDEAAADANDDLARQVRRLVSQLNDDSARERDAAEQKLVDLAGTNAASVDRLLELLPTPSDQMPVAMRDRLTRIRRVAEDRAAKAAVVQTTVTLDAKERPAWDVLSEIAQQTGNRFNDRRRQGAPGAGPVSVSFEEEPFWSAVDQVLDQSKLGIYTYAGDDALAIVDRDAGDGPRHGAAAYRGPFRVEVLEVQGQRNLRQPDRQSLKLQLEVSWEPRLRPIVVSQPMADVVALDEAGRPLEASQVDAVLSSEVPAGTQAAELILPFELPPREATKIASLRGKLRALVPGRQVKFQFDELADAAGTSQRRGGVEVAIDAVRKNGEIWEIHMRMVLDEDSHALESHRGWAFQNLSYLVDKDGQSIDNAGLETTMQSTKQVGVAYLFYLPDGIEGLSWVYETPAAIVELPVEYELTDIRLP